MCPDRSLYRLQAEREPIVFSYLKHEINMKLTSEGILKSTHFSILSPQKLIYSPV